MSKRLLALLDFSVDLFWAQNGPGIIVFSSVLGAQALPKDSSLW